MIQTLDEGLTGFVFEAFTKSPYTWMAVWETIYQTTSMPENGQIVFIALQNITIPYYLFFVVAVNFKLFYLN